MELLFAVLTFFPLLLKPAGVTIKCNARWKAAVPDDLECRESLSKTIFREVASRRKIARSTPLKPCYAHNHNSHSTIIIWAPVLCATFYVIWYHVCSIESFIVYELRETFHMQNMCVWFVPNFRTSLTVITKDWHVQKRQNPGLNEAVGQGLLHNKVGYYTGVCISSTINLMVFLKTIYYAL